jgi:protein-disulfide isomerase
VPAPAYVSTVTLALSRLAPSRLLALAFLAAALMTGVLVAASRLDARSEGAATPTAAASVAGAAAVRVLLRGIPQQGNVLGRPDAPVTLVEYADLQCPYCGVFARETFPALVRDYVRTGKVRIVWRGLAFVGPDSQPALAAAAAAARQDRLFDVVSLLYENQGVENSGWVTPSLLRRVGGTVRGLDSARVSAESGSSAVAATTARWSSDAAAAGVQGTPTFEVGRTGDRLAPLQLSSLGIDAFRPTLDRLLAS